MRSRSRGQWRPRRIATSGTPTSLPPEGGAEAQSPHPGHTARKVAQMAADKVDAKTPARNAEERNGVTLGGHACQPLVHAWAPPRRAQSERRGHLERPNAPPRAPRTTSHGALRRKTPSRGHTTSAACRRRPHAPMPRPNLHPGMSTSQRGFARESPGCPAAGHGRERQPASSQTLHDPSGTHRPLPLPDPQSELRMLRRPSHGHAPRQAHYGYCRCRTAMSPRAPSGPQPRMHGAIANASSDMMTLLRSYK